MANEVSQSRKRVIGRASSSHHVRVEDCQCGDDDQMIVAGVNAGDPQILCSDSTIDAVASARLELTAPSVVVIMAAAVSGSLQTGRIDIRRQINNPYLTPGTSVLDQETILFFGGAGCDAEPALFELEACEELPAGEYVWTLFAHQTTNAYAAWIKAHSVT